MPHNNLPDASNSIRLVRVFVSSPNDLLQEQEALKDVVNRINATYEQRPVRLELWKWNEQVPPRIGPPPQNHIEAQLPACDIYLGIMAHRFGTPTDRFGSGTEAEFSQAYEKWCTVGRPWILFYFNDEPIRVSEIDLDQAKQVKDFRAKLSALGLVATYEGVRGKNTAFFDKVDLHLRQVVDKILALDSEVNGAPAPEAILATYLDVACREFESVRKSRRPFDRPSSPNGPLPTVTLTGRPLVDTMLKSGEESPVVSLQDFVTRNRFLYIVGEPGAGKTTFLQTLVGELCKKARESTPKPDAIGGAPANGELPVFVRLADLAKFLERNQGADWRPNEDASPKWIIEFVARGDTAQVAGLTTDLLHDLLGQGRVTLLCDALDEVVGEDMRGRIASIMRATKTRFVQIRLVITSRPNLPAAYALSEFARVAIEPLTLDQIERSLVGCPSEDSFGTHLEPDAARRLTDSLRSSVALQRLASNPMMLSAIVCLHRSQKRLPEQRAELYEEIVKWLAEERLPEGKRKQFVDLLGQLAFSMQTKPDGPRFEAAVREAAEFVYPMASSRRLIADNGSVIDAEELLTSELAASGVILVRDSSTSFWHRSFQEYLCAKHIADQPTGQQFDLLIGGPDANGGPARIYQQEWSEVVVLCAGLLRKQGPLRAEELIRRIIGSLSADPSLADKARCVGLVGDIARDLSPYRFAYADSDGQYAELRREVMAIFEKAGAANVSLSERIRAADSLGPAAVRGLDRNSPDYWVEVPGDRFLRGAQRRSRRDPGYDPEAFDDESPASRIESKPFKIAKFPVTVGQFEPFVESGYGDRKCWDQGRFGDWQQPANWTAQLPFKTRPVVGVTWYEAAAFCHWLGDGCQLPTEAQWERAARGKSGRKYPWRGNAIARKEYLNCETTAADHPTPVGIFPEGATPDGICDMAGNVWEWCWDVPYDYDVDKSGGRNAGANATYRAIRGGSFKRDKRGCRAAYRGRYKADNQNDSIGFRLIVTSSARTTK